jgi:hypothetical protein
MAASKIPKRFITPLTNDEIAAGAGIETSKLAAALELLMRNGSVALTGNLSAGTFKITDLGTATNSGDAVGLGQMNSAIAAAIVPGNGNHEVRASTTANINISNPGTSTFDGVTLTSGQLFFVGYQTAPAENGVYVFNGSGSAATRSPDMNAWDEVPASLVIVKEGTLYADKVFLITANDGGTLGTTAITHVPFGVVSGMSEGNFVTNVVPSGTVNGSNVTFTLPSTPTAGSVRLYDAILLRPGAGNDYTLSGATITMAVAPLTGEELRANYRIA